MRGLSTVAVFSFALGLATSEYRILRQPDPSDLLPFLKAVPKFPQRLPSFVPAFISNARVDYGVGLPGGRGHGGQQGCSENRTLALWDYGLITSPNYPEDYPANTQCEWLLESPAGTKIHATIFDVHMQPWFLNYFDSVSISRDGEFYRVDNYAGDQNDRTPFTVVSNETRFGVRFKSNGIFNYRGFKLAYVVRPVDETVDPYVDTANDMSVCGRPVSVAPPTTTTTVAPTTAETVVETTTTVPTSPDGTRIIGETPASPHGFPWMVAMLIDNKSFCGGSIIDESHILTAAHCTNGAEQITLLIGAHNIRASKEEEPQRLVVNVTKESIYTHPKYNMDSIIYDISIIRLPEKLVFSNAIRPVCLPTRKYLAETFEKRAVTVTGWGITADRGKVSPVLQQTNVTVLNNGECRQVFRDILTGNNICVKTTPTMSPCRGDSGGPLMIREAEDTSDPYYTIVGIVSFGTHTCERGYPVAFTRVTAFLDYVTIITGKKLY